MLDVLRVEAKKAAEIIENHDFVRIFTHYDADGISSASIICAALLREGKQFHVTFLRGLIEKIEVNSGLVILQDMGSGQPDIISEIDSDVIIADHHYPSGKIKPKKRFAHVNPHLAGIDGTFELSASGAAYIIANQLGNNTDLSGLAMIGMFGDKQKITGGNAEIVKEGIEMGYISGKKGLNMFSGKVREVLTLSTEPYLDFYGNEEKLNEFLNRVKIDGEKEMDELDEEEVRRLSNAIVLRILELGGYEGVIEEFIGTRYLLNNEIVGNAIMLSEIVNSCGRASAYSTGFSICMRDESYLEKGTEIWKKFQIELLEEIVKRKNEVKEGEAIRYIIMGDAKTTSPVATALSRYIFSDRPLVVVNVKNDMAKISSRSNLRIAENVNLSDVMRKAAEKVGGRGGGHSVAAGANISPDKVDDFIKEVDRLVGLSMG
ncbi:MAG TPA: DHH family phosphoesterase [Archaeoglobaceae archaeon]|nr:DHH family phosphoesterase [Archaeoglobaceae archaeon]